jgi:hypothetical protein
LHGIVEKNGQANRIKIGWMKVEEVEKKGNRSQKIQRGRGEIWRKYKKEKKRRKSDKQIEVSCHVRGMKETSPAAVIHRKSIQNEAVRNEPTNHIAAEEVS